MFSELPCSRPWKEPKVKSAHAGITRWLDVIPGLTIHNFINEEGFHNLLPSRECQKYFYILGLLTWLVVRVPARVSPNGIFVTLAFVLAKHVIKWLNKPISIFYIFSFLTWCEYQRGYHNGILSQSLSTSYSQFTIAMKSSSISSIYNPAPLVSAQQQTWP